MFCVKDTLDVLSFGIVLFLCEILENTTLIIFRKLLPVISVIVDQFV